MVARQRSELDPRKALAAARKAAQGIASCVSRLLAAGQASKIKPVAMDDMARRYG